MRKVNKRVPVEKQARMLRRKLSIRKKLLVQLKGQEL